MKTFKLLFLFLVVTAGTFYSCSDSNPIENQADTQKSIALRTTINEYKKALNNNSRLTENEDSVFCFSFLYPITLSYNDGTQVTVSSYAGFLDLLENETANFYLAGIAFPFQVSEEGAVTTIDTEEEFTALLEACGYDTWNDDLYNTFCFDIVFPISVTAPQGQTVVINSLAEFNTYLTTPANGVEASIVYPISVLYNGETVVINNMYELYEMINNCDSCICTEEYAPVCVNSGGVTLQFANMCFALCAGYTQNDIVSCGPATGCNIDNLTAAPGACNPNGSYQLTLNFTYTDPGTTHFQVRNNSGILVGTYALSQLPLTIQDYPNSGQGADYVTVNVVGDTSCSAVQQWAVPNCPGVDCEGFCPTDYNPVCVQTIDGLVQFSNECHALCAGYTSEDFVICDDFGVYNFAALLGDCFVVNYPVQVQHEGALVSIISDGQLLQYYFPATAQMPAFNYPITVAFGNTVVTFNSQAEFENQIVNTCN